MSDKSAEQRLEDASAWWSTSIIDIHPGSIAIRGYPIQQLIGELRFPEMIWLMLRGDIPSAAQLRLLEATLVAGVDHGPHAPSIAVSRMAVSCGLPLNGAMASAINTLDDVHGGAGQQCMELMRGIALGADDGEPSEDFVAVALERHVATHGKIVPGFGHRWHGIDPRAVRLLQLVQDAQREGTVRGNYARIAQHIERWLGRHKGVPIPMNIDGICAAIHLELGFEPALGRGLFILSRSVGILAHAWEQTGEGRRIKGPMSPGIPYRYTGPEPRSLAPKAEADAPPAARPVPSDNGR